MSSYKELMAQKAELEARIAEARKAEITAALNKIRELATEFNLGSDEILQALGHSRAAAASRTRKPVAPKYRNPETGATWSGRGREPAWLAGRNREDFAI